MILQVVITNKISKTQLVLISCYVHDIPNSKFFSPIFIIELKKKKLKNQNAQSRTHREEGIKL